MNAGIDLGYSWTKALAGKRGVGFPSLVGTPDRARFSLNGAASGITLIRPRHVQIGELAMIQSRHVERREDRAWIESEAYYDLYLAALTSLTRSTFCRLVVVSGLPIQFYERDQGLLRERLLGVHSAQREGQSAQRFEVADVRVIPQGFGALLSVVLNDAGNIVAADLANGRVGVIDVGGKTTNLLSVNHLSEVGRETASVSSGAWSVARAVRRWLSDHCPDLELRDHEVIQAMTDRYVRYYGEVVGLGEVVDGAIAPLADQVVAEATQLWNGAASLDAVFVAGGGAHLVGPRLQAHFRHARIVGEMGIDPVYANALGYWRFAQRVGNTR